MSDTMSDTMARKSVPQNRLAVNPTLFLDLFTVKAAAGGNPTARKETQI